MAVDLNVLNNIGLANPNAEAKSENELAQSDFLKLMTTQLQAQDPLKPEDNAEFLSQLAQFSTVQGIEDINSSLDRFGSSFLGTQSLQASNLVGREVLTDSGSGFLSTDGNLDGFIELPSSATNVAIQITDSSGQLVRKLPLGTRPGGQSQFSWDGRDDKGERLPPGNYGIEATGLVGGRTEAVNVLAKSKVQSINVGGGNEVVLNLEGFGSVPFSQIKQVQ
ncbi:MAG: flagellar hook assembly protein FlgD [Methylococcales bacterium]|jgi:flagellar basal-body rod modification protein FlgD|nr:flagellar hook assembly protein FlgD [Methylococcales bacterium]